MSRVPDGPGSISTCSSPGWKVQNWNGSQTPNKHLGCGINVGQQKEFMNVAALIAGELSVPRSAGWDVLEVLEKSVSLSQGIHEHLLSKKLLEKLNILQTNKQTNRTTLELGAFFC